MTTSGTVLRDSLKGRCLPASLYYCHYFVASNNMVLT